MVATRLNDVERLRDYIAQDSPFYARRFTEKLLAGVRKLKRFPKLGRLVPEADSAQSELRELIYYSYRIIYQCDAEGVTVVTVIHGSRDLSSPANQPWEEN